MDKRGLILLLLLAGLAASQAKRPVTITVKNFTCAYALPSLVNEFTCFSSKQPKATTLNVRFSLKQILDKFRILIDFDVLKRDNSRVKIQHSSLDGCLYLTPACKHTFSGNIIDALFGISNLPRKCPLLPNKVYEIRNYTITLDRIPLVMSSLNYISRIRILRYKDVIADVSIEASAKN